MGGGCVLPAPAGLPRANSLHRDTNSGERGGVRWGLHRGAGWWEKASEERVQTPHTHSRPGGDAGRGGVGRAGAAKEGGQ